MCTDAWSAIWRTQAGDTFKTPPLKNQKRKNMPSYHVEMLEGRTIEQKKKLVEAITRVSVEILGGAPDSVDVIITDIKRENWATGGKLWSEPRG
jgi:4-oxalocrotonate tautomerase